MLKLHDICRPKQWPTVSSGDLTNTGFPVYGANGRIGCYSEFNHAHPTVLITCRGATCGAINICEPKSYVTGNSMALDDLDDQINLHFLAHYLRNRGFVDVISGSAQPQITREGLTKIMVPVPSIEEQRRIAAILAQAEALRAKRRQALAKLDTLTQSLFLEMFGDPLSNSKRLPTRPLGEIANFVGGGTPRRLVQAYFTGKTCWATPKDIRGRYLSDTEEHITDEAIARSATNLVPAGTILIVVKSKVLLRRLPVVIADVSTCFGQDLKGLKLADCWPAEYVAQHIRMSEDVLLRLARGANTEGLTIDHLSRLPMLEPPRDLREKYATAEVALKMSTLRAEQQLGLIEQNMKSLQHRAFRGEL